MLTVDALNNILPLLVIMKDKNIPQNLQDLEDTNLILGTQENAWVNEDLFLKWIQRDGDPGP